MHLYLSIDNLSFFFIEEAVSSASFLLHSITALIFLIQFFSKSFKILYLSMFLIYSGLATVLEYYAWTFGIEALRRIDPNWDERQGLLYPYFFYLFVKEESDQERQVESTFITLPEDPHQILVTL